MDNTGLGEDAFANREERRSQQIGVGVLEQIDAADRGHASGVEPHHAGGDTADLRRRVADIDDWDSCFVAQPHQIGQDLTLVSGVERELRSDSGSGDYEARLTRRPG